MANTDKIERKAVRAVEEYLDECPKLKPIINSNDKTPIWDGDIYIYINDNHKNENFFARVPLQVKGTTIADDNTYRINREYLAGFKAERGTAFFMVKEDGNTSQVFYALLTSKDIEDLLRQTTKTINIPLQEVPSNPLDFEKELYEFAANRNNLKVENTSPKEIQDLVEGFEGLREHLEKIDNKDARYELESSLDFIKNLKVEDTVGWRDKFYFFSRKAIDLAINNIEGYDFAELQFNLGNYLQEQKQYHLAEDYYLKSLNEYRKRSDIVNEAVTLNNLAVLHDKLALYDEAENEFNEALKIYCELAKTNRDAYIGEVAMTLNNLGNLHYNLTRYDEADREHKEALKIYRELAKTNSDAYKEYVATTINNLGELHRVLTRYDEAEKEYNEALQIRRELAKTNRDVYIADVAMTLNNLGILHKDLTRYTEAEKEYKEALEIRRELAETNRDAYIGDVAMILNNLAVLHALTNRNDKAEKEWEEALEIYRELAKTNRDAYIFYVAAALNNLGNLHRNLTRYDEAEKEFKEALKIRRELAETNRDAYIGDVAMTLENIARLQAVTYPIAVARGTAEEALGIYDELAKAYPQIWNRNVFKTLQLLEYLSE